MAMHYRSITGFMVSEKIFKVSPHYKSMEANDTEGMANSDPRGMVGMTYVGDHPTLLYYKHLSCWPCG